MPFGGKKTAVFLPWHTSYAWTEDWEITCQLSVSVRLRTLQAKNYWSKSPDISLQNKGLHTVLVTLWRSFRRQALEEVMEADTNRIMIIIALIKKYLVLVVWPLRHIISNFHNDPIKPKWYPPAQKGNWGPERLQHFVKSHCCKAVHLILQSRWQRRS